MLPLLERQCVIDELTAKTKEDVLVQMGIRLDAEGYLSDRTQFAEDLNEREMKYPTYIGYGIGIPHCLSDGVCEDGLCIARLASPVRWSDRKKDSDVSLVIMIAANGNREEANVKHLHLLASLSMLLMHEDFRESIFSGTPDFIYQKVTEVLGTDSLESTGEAEGQL